MKTIKTFLLAGMTAILLTPLTSCTDYQDEIDALDVRVTYLESLVKEANTNLQSLQALVDVIKKGDVITKITETPTGYTIAFSNHDPITILHGKDATMPIITVEQDPTDGNYYWKIDGEWLTTDGKPNGPRVQANGKDGKDGVSPKVKIGDDGYWYISPDGSETGYVRTNTPVKGEDGKDGKNTNPITNVLVDTAGGIVTFVLYGEAGGKIVVPLKTS